MANDTNLQAVIKDTDGVIWAGATWAANVVGFISTFGRPPTYLSTGQPITTHLSGQTDATGLLAVTLASNNAIVPFGTQWEFTIQAAASVPPSRALVTVTGASMDATVVISQQLTPISQAGPIPGGTPTRVLPAANEASAIAESQANPNNIYYWVD